eukprot:s44_g41.t1
MRRCGSVGIYQRESLHHLRPRQDHCHAVEWARRQWAELQLQQLRKLSKEQRQPFLRRRPKALPSSKDPAKSEDEVSTRHIVDLKSLFYLITRDLPTRQARDSSRSGRPQGQSGKGGGVTKLEDLQQRYAELSPSYGHLGVPDALPDLATASRMGIRATKASHLEVTRRSLGQELLVRSYPAELQAILEATPCCVLMPKFYTHPVKKQSGTRTRTLLSFRPSDDDPRCAHGCAMSTGISAEVDAELLEKSDEKESISRVPRQRLKSLALLLAVTLLLLGDGHFFEAVRARPRRFRWTPRGTLQLAAPGPERFQSLCVVNVAQIVGRLANQGALINTVSNVCDYPALQRQRHGPVTEEEKQRCANFLMLTIINTDLIVGLVTGSLTACAQSLNVPANCATNIASMLGMIVLMAQAGVQIQLDCIDDRNITEERNAAVAKAQEIKADVQRSVQKFLKDHGRDGLALLPPNPAVPKNTVYSNGALCFGVITLVASFTMRLGVVLADAAFTCPEEQDTELGRRDCALDVLGVLGLVSVIIRFSGLASNACVAIVGDSNPTGQCVVATSSIPTAAFSLTAAATNVEAACHTGFETWDPNAWPTKKQVMFPLVDNGDVVLPVI